jgi:hypothetical protein
MTKDAAPDKGANGPGSNLDVHPQDGGINPSAPTAGTEGWGTTAMSGACWAETIRPIPALGR